jgi:hypothetical protein
MSFVERLTRRIGLAGLWLGCRRALLRLALLACLIFSVHGQTAEEREIALKTAFLYNFFSYVQWPQKSTDQADAPFVVGVVGENSFDAVLSSLNGKNVKGRRIQVRKVDDLNDVNACHLIFITASEEKRQSQILDQARNHAVLTVGESTGFTREGGMINLVPSRNRVQLEINPDAAEKAGLTISSQLLKLAKIVKG